jgi:two-component system, cell cycle sensor histidine kinase and response regulator CckA
LVSTEGPVERGQEGKTTVLLADDEEPVLLVAQAILERLGFGVLTASSGLEAVALYRAHGSGISLALLDVNMPGMDGEQALRALREVNPGVRVILSSGYTPEEIASQLTEAPPNGYIQKPFKVEDLRQALEDALAQ